MVVAVCLQAMLICYLLTGGVDCRANSADEVLAFVYPRACGTIP